MTSKGNGESKAEAKPQVEHAHSKHHLFEMPPPEEYVECLEARLAGIAADALFAARMHRYPLPDEFGDYIARAAHELRLWKARANRKFGTSARINREVERDDEGNPKGRR